MVNLPAKSLPLVVSAIRNLRELKGCTSREILHYLSSVYNVPIDVARRQTHLALKRAVAYGILRKKDDHYVLPMVAEGKHQDLALQEIDLLDIWGGRSRAGGCKKKRRKCKCRSKRRAARAGRSLGCKKRRRRRRSRGCKKRRRSKGRCKRTGRKKCKCGGKRRGHNEDGPMSSKKIEKSPARISFEQIEKTNDLASDSSNESVGASIEN